MLELLESYMIPAQLEKDSEIANFLPLSFLYQRCN
jgi:hypothetical protein